MTIATLQFLILCPQSKSWYGEILCVRMGTHISERLHKEGEENVPLYAATKAINLLDLYLSKECSFSITGDTGMNIYPYMFNRPIVFHNWNVLAYLAECSLHLYCQNCINQCYWRSFDV